MSKNSVYNETIGKWKSTVNPKLTVSLESKKKEIPENTNWLYELLYQQNKICTSMEKEIIINQFFANLFDGNLVKWSVRVNQSDHLELVHLLNKYLKKSNFSLNLWQTKFKSGIFGRYGMVILKKEVGKDKDDNQLTQPYLIPVRVIYKNLINDKIFESELEFEDDSYKNGENSFNLKRKYSLLENNVIVDSTLINVETKKEILETELNEVLKSNLKIGQETFPSNFIPVAILKNNLDEVPRLSIVSSRMEMLNKFDEMLAILPAWEKGAILTNTDSVTAQNQEQQNRELIKNLLLKGFNQFKAMEIDGNPINLSDNVMIFQPNSIMKKVKTTRDWIWAEIKEDLSLPTLKEELASEVMIKQFLTSPIIEREKTLMKSFLRDLAKKFLIVLGECKIEEDFPSGIDWEKVEIDVDFDVISDKNISETIKQISLLKSEQIQEEENSGSGD